MVDDSFFFSFFSYFLTRHSFPFNFLDINTNGSREHESPQQFSPRKTLKITKMATYNFSSGAEFFRAAVIWAACH